MSDIYYGRVKDTPVGDVLVAVHRDGVLATDVGASEEDFITRIEGQTGRRPVHSPEQTAAARQQIAELMQGVRSEVDLPLDLSALTAFQREVLQATLEVGRGAFTTYSEIARRLGKPPTASRAIGQALARNPLPIVIPCHRVLAANGALTGYSGAGGVETKARLLEIEGALMGAGSETQA